VQPTRNEPMHSNGGVQPVYSYLLMQNEQSAEVPGCRLACRKPINRQAGYFPEKHLPLPRNSRNFKLDIQKFYKLQDFHCWSLHSKAAWMKTKSASDSSSTPIGLNSPCLATFYGRIPDSGARCLHPFI